MTTTLVGTPDPDEPATKSATSALANMVGNTTADTGTTTDPDRAALLKELIRICDSAPPEQQEHLRRICQELTHAVTELVTHTVIALAAIAAGAPMHTEDRQ